MEHLEKLSGELLELCERAAPWVVRVNGRRGPNASGVLWSNDLVITSLRAVHRDSEIEVGTHDGRTVMARVDGGAPDYDLVALRLEKAVESGAVPWSASWKPGLVLGLARDRRGNLLSKVGLVPGEELVHRVSPSPEFLGSPLIDIQGRFLGLHLLVGGPTVVPYSTLSSLVERLGRGENLEPGFLGLGLHRVDQESGPACLVVKVEGPARCAGVQIGDSLLAMDGVRVTDPEEVRESLRSRSAESEVELRLLRAGKEHVLSVKLDARPAPPPHFGGMKHHLKRFIKRHFHGGPPCGPHGGPPFGPPHGHRGGPPHRGPWGGGPPGGPPPSDEGPEVC